MYTVCGCGRSISLWFSYKLLSIITTALPVISHSPRSLLCSAKKEEVDNLEREIDFFKRSILKEEEKNEQLTLLLNKSTSEEKRVKKQIKISNTKKEQLETEYITFTRILQETQQSLTEESMVHDTPRRWDSCMLL